MKSLSLGIWNSKDFFYTGEETDINKIKDVEFQLGYKLPESYVNLLLERNGWSLVNYPTLKRVGFLGSIQLMLDIFTKLYG